MCLYDRGFAESPGFGDRRGFDANGPASGPTAEWTLLPGDFCPCSDTRLRDLSHDVLRAELQPAAPGSGNARRLFRCGRDRCDIFQRHRRSAAADRLEPDQSVMGVQL